MIWFCYVPCSQTTLLPHVSNQLLVSNGSTYATSSFPTDLYNDFACLKLKVDLGGPCLIRNGLHESSCQCQWHPLLPIFPPVDHECFFLLWSKLWTYNHTHHVLFNKPNWTFTSFSPIGLDHSLMEKQEVLRTIFLFSIEVWNIYVGRTKQIHLTTFWIESSKWMRKNALREKSIC